MTDRKYSDDDDMRMDVNCLNKRRGRKPNSAHPHHTVGKEESEQLIKQANQTVEEMTRGSKRVKRTDMAR
jgi:hypothetical protein